MFLGGLWHGAAWTFVVWGLLHGRVPGRARGRARGRSDAAVGDRQPRHHVRRGGGGVRRLPRASFGDAIDVLSGMAGLHGIGVVSFGAAYALTVAALLVFVNVAPNTWEITVRPTPRVAAALGLVAAFSVLQIAEPSPFLYFQFWLDRYGCTLSEGGADVGDRLDHVDRALARRARGHVPARAVRAAAGRRDPRERCEGRHLRSALRWHQHLAHRRQHGAAPDARRVLHDDDVPRHVRLRPRRGVEPRRLRRLLGGARQRGEDVPARAGRHLADHRGRRDAGGAGRRALRRRSPP